MWKCFKLRRNVVAMMTFLGTMNAYILRINFSVAIVNMTADRFVQNDNGTTSQIKIFNWNSVQKGVILSAFFYGYLVTQIIGGYMASRYGGVTVFGLSIGIPALLTFLTPFCANISITALVLLRVLEGAFEGAVFPSMKAVWAKWAPPPERTRLTSVSNAGTGLGSVLAFSGCGLIADILGWPYAFYIPAVGGTIWYIVWFLYITNDPNDDPYISREELKYLRETLDQSNARIKYPWKQILTSGPVWTIVLSGFCESWGGYTLLTQLPMYLKDKYHYDAGIAGSFLTVPYILKSFTTIGAGIIADKLRKKMLTTTQVRKLCTCGAYTIDAIFTAIVGFTDSPVTSMACLAMSIGFGAVTLAGSGVNPLDLAPQYASVIGGLANTFSTLSGILAPNVAGFIVQDGTESQWRTVFLISSCTYVMGAVIYGVFATGKLQPWAIYENVENKDTELKTYDQIKNNDKNNTELIKTFDQINELNFDKL